MSTVAYIIRWRSTGDTPEEREKDRQEAESFVAFLFVCMAVYILVCFGTAAWDILKKKKPLP